MYPIYVVRSCALMLALTACAQAAPNFNRDGIVGLSEVAAAEVVARGLSPAIDTRQLVEIYDVQVGGSEPIIVTITNVGGDLLRVGEMAIDNPLEAPFLVDPGECYAGQILDTYDICYYQIFFAPTALETSTDSFEINTNDPVTPAFEVTVVGNPITPRPGIELEGYLAFHGDYFMAPTRPGGVSTIEFIIHSTGQAPLSIGQIASADPLDSPLSIASDPCSGSTIAPGDSCVFEVAFAPQQLISISDSFDVPAEGDFLTVTVFAGTSSIQLLTNNLSPAEVGSCMNASTGELVTVPLQKQTHIDCDAEGLTVATGERVRMLVRGVATSSQPVATPNGIDYQTARIITCTNLSSGQFASAVSEGGSFDCASLGIDVNAGDHVVLTVAGLSF